jgi:outer membrane murein-binding lipoprotein Lpp
MAIDETKEKELESRLQDLLEKTHQINDDISKTREGIMGDFDRLEKQIDDSTAKIDALCADIEAAENETSVAIDDLLLAHAAEEAENV